MSLPPKRSTARVTLRDIAREAGVHFTTVGLALRGSSELPETTRRRIREIADRMGYRPDPMLSALNAYRSAKGTPRYKATIAWINNWPRREDLHQNQGFHEYYQGAMARAEELGYLVEEFWLREEGMHPDRMASVLHARNIEAVLLAPQPEPRMFVPMDFSRFAVIAFGYSLQPSIFHVVTNHHFHSMNLLLDHVRDLGYRSIGLFVASEWNEKVENSLLGGLALAEWKDRKLRRIPPLMQDRATDEVLTKWLRKHQPDLVISHSATVGRLRKLGFRVPEDIGFASLSLAQGEGDVSGLFQSNRQIGRAAVDFVVSMLHSGERGIPQVPMRTLVESAWNSGKTLRVQKE